MSEQNQLAIHLVDQAGSRLDTWSLEGKTSFRLGRGKENEIVLPYSWVSRKHAIIQVEANGLCNLIDLGSSNGTFLNGRRIYAPAPLRSGDRVEIGQTGLVFVQNQEAAATPCQAQEDLDDRTVAFVQRAMVTVLICDLHDFTGLSDRLGNQAVSTLLRQWTAIADQVVTRCGGTVDKFIGDAVLAVWTTEGGKPGTIRQAMAAALQLDDATRALGRSIDGLQEELTIGAAMNTGEAVLGNMGVDGRRDFTVVGDAINIVFRLEEMTSRQAGLDLLLGPETTQRLGDFEDHFRPLACRIKGKDEPITAYSCSFQEAARYLGTVTRH